jgi:hypothetical protein
VLLEFTSLFPMGRAESAWVFQWISDTVGGIAFRVVLEAAATQARWGECRRRVAIGDDRAALLQRLALATADGAERRCGARGRTGRGHRYAAIPLSNASLSPCSSPHRASWSAKVPT